MNNAKIHSWLVSRCNTDKNKETYHKLLTDLHVDIDVDRVFIDVDYLYEMINDFHMYSPDAHVITINNSNYTPVVSTTLLGFNERRIDLQEVRADSLHEALIIVLICVLMQFPTAWLSTFYGYREDNNEC